MAAVHFTTIPCEPYIAHKVQGKPNFSNVCPCADNNVYASFEGFRTFLYVVLSNQSKFELLSTLE